MWFELLDLVVRGSDIIHVIYRIVADNAVKLRFLKHIGLSLQTLIIS
jgi:hypothetical protein